MNNEKEGLFVDKQGKTCSWRLKKKEEKRRREEKRYLALIKKLGNENFKHLTRTEKDCVTTKIEDT